jgi:hypothetical protein
MKKFSTLGALLQPCKPSCARIWHLRGISHQGQCARKPNRSIQAFRRGPHPGSLVSRAFRNLQIQADTLSVNQNERCPHRSVTVQCSHTFRSSRARPLQYECRNMDCESHIGLALPAASLGFRPDFLDFQRGIRVGKLEDNQHITGILKFVLESEYGQPLSPSAAPQPAHCSAPCRQAAPRRATKRKSSISAGAPCKPAQVRNSHTQKGTAVFSGCHRSQRPARPLAKSMRGTLKLKEHHEPTGRGHRG